MSELNSARLRLWRGQLDVLGVIYTTKSAERVTLHVNMRKNIGTKCEERGKMKQYNEQLNKG